MPRVTADYVFGVHQPLPEGGKWGNRLGASVDSYQANLYGLGEALTGSEWMRERREANDLDAEWQREQARRQGAISSYKDVNGVGDAVDYIGGLAVDSLPYLGEAVVGGLTGGSSLVAGNLARAGISRGVARSLGGVAASYPSAVGDILANQREETGTMNLGAAAAGGVPYAALNALGLEGALARGTVTRSGIRALDEMTGLTGLGLRTGTSMLKNAAVEGPSEVGQEMINQSFGRMAVNPEQTLFNPEANDRYMESFVGGAALGGVFGGAAGGWRRSEGYLPPGDTVDKPGQTDLLAGTPRIDPGAEPGTQGGLFGDLGPEGMASSLPAYGETTELDRLRSDFGELTAMAEEARLQGDTARLEAVNRGMRQTWQQIRALEPQDTSRAPLLPSGVHELVSGQPVELFNYELDNNLVPFVGDKGIDFPMGGQPYQYEGAVDATGLYPSVGEQPLVPQGLRLPSSEFSTGTDIPVAPMGDMQVDMFGNVAASPLDLSLQNDPGAVIARQQWLKSQESVNAAKAVQQEVEAQRADAGRYGIKGDKAVEVFVAARDMLQQGDIDQGTFNTWAGLLAARKMGAVRDEIKAVEGTKAAAAAIKANDEELRQNAIANVQNRVKNGTQTTQTVQAKTQGSETLPTSTQGVSEPKVDPNAPTAARVQQRLDVWAVDFPQMPKFDWLSSREVAQLEDLESRGELNLAAAQTVLGANQAAAKPTQETDEASDFRRNLADNLDKMGDEDRFIFQEWLGVDVDEDGNLDLRESGGKSYASIGAKLPNSKTGQLGMSKEAVRKKVNATLKNLGYEGVVSPKVLHQRLGFALAGTDLETINRNVDFATQDDMDADPVELDLGGATGTTVDGEARAAEMESGTNDDVGSKEEGYDVDLDAARQREQEAGILMDYLADDTSSGRVLDSDIAGARYVFDVLMGKGTGAFASQPVSKQAESARLYARARVNGDPTVKKVEANLNAENQTGTGTGAVTRNPETVQPGDGQAADGKPAASGGAQQAGSAVREVSQVGNQAPVVVVKKKRWGAAPTDEARPVTPFTGQVGVASDNEPETNQSSRKSEPKTPQGAGSVSQRDGQGTSAKESVSRRSGRGTTVQRVTEEVRKFLRLDALGRRVVVVQSVSDLPPGVKVSSKSRTQGVAVDAGEKGRVAYLIADNIGVSNIRAVFMHEVGAHLGLDNLLKPEDYQALTEQIKAWAQLGQQGSQKIEHVLAFKAVNRSFDAGTKDEDRRSEALAYFVEEALKAGIDPTATRTGNSPLLDFFRRVMRQFASVVSKLGLNPDKLTAQDVVDLAYGAAYIEMTEGGPVATGAALKTASVKLSTAEKSSELAELGGQALKALKDWTFLRGAFTRDILDAAAKLMPAVNAYRTQMQKARVESQKLERTVASVLDDFNGLAAHERGTGPASVNVLVRDMTYGNKWAFAPDWYKSAVVDPELAARFNAMSKPAQAVVRRVFQTGHTMLKQAQEAALESIRSEVDPLIAAARANGDMQTVKELEKAKVEADGKFRRLMEIRGTTPYAPLRRFGNWAVVVKSQRYVDAEKAKDQAELDKLTRDGNHYRVEFVSNKLAALGRAKKLQSEFGDSYVDAFERMDDKLLYGGESVFKAFSRFRNLAREEMEDADVKVVASLDKTLASMYMALVAETSARTSEFDRKNVAGADADMMRAFASQGRAMAGFIGSLKTTGDVMDTLRTLKLQAREPGGTTQKSELYNEILRRHAMGLDYEPNQLLDKSLAFNSYWSLVTTPSYLLTNLTQPWVVSMPVLAARFGAGRSFSEMIRAYKEIGRIATQLVDNPDAVKLLPDDVRAAVEELLNRGAIDISIGADLGSFTSGGDSPVSAGVQKALRMPRTLVERGEMVNRIATAVTAYRLAKSAGKMTEAEVVDYADRVIYETHGDYTAFNTPRFMRTGAGRIMTQFRKFQLIQLSLYARLIRDAVKGMKAEDRMVARKALAYSLTTMFALGGVTALPGYMAISFLLGSVLGAGDDDEPDDAEATLRRLLGGGPEADLLLRGIPNAAGVNLSGRIGAGGMLSVLPYTDLEASRDGYKDIMLGLAGPFLGGTLPKALDGVGLLSEGKYAQGLEQLMPRGVADLIKAGRFASEGVTKRNGDVVLSPDEVSFFAAAAQAVGLPNTTLTDTQMVRNSQFKADTFYKDRTSQLKQQYVEAYRSGDGVKLQELRTRWRETQEARKRLGYDTQPLSSLLKAPQEQRKREAKPLNLELVQ